MRNAVAKRHIWGGNIHSKRGAQTNHQPGRRPVCTAREMPKVAVASVLKATLVSNWVPARGGPQGRFLPGQGRELPVAIQGQVRHGAGFGGKSKAARTHNYVMLAEKKADARGEKKNRKSIPEQLGSWFESNVYVRTTPGNGSLRGHRRCCRVIFAKEEVATKHTRQAIRGGKSFAACPARADKIGVRGLETSTIMPVGGLELPSGVRWGPVTPPSVAAPGELDGELCLRCRLMRCRAVPSRRGLAEPDYPAPRP